jgi:hypothetical protein
MFENMLYENPKIYVRKNNQLHSKFLFCLAVKHIGIQVYLSS